MKRDSSNNTCKHKRATFTKREKTSREYKQEEKRTKEIAKIRREIEKHENKIRLLNEMKNTTLYNSDQERYDKLVEKKIIQSTKKAEKIINDFSIFAYERSRKYLYEKIKQTDERLDKLEEFKDNQKLSEAAVDKLARAIIKSRAYPSLRQWAIGAELTEQALHNNLKKMKAILYDMGEILYKKREGNSIRVWVTKKEKSS